MKYTEPEMIILNLDVVDVIVTSECVCDGVNESV